MVDNVIENIKSIKTNVPSYETQLSSFIETVEEINTKIGEITNMSGENITSLLINIHSMDNLLKKNTYDGMESIVKTENKNWRTFMANFSLFLSDVPKDGDLSLDDVLDSLNDNLLELTKSLNQVILNIESVIDGAQINKRLKIELPESKLEYKTNDEDHTEIVTTLKITEDDTKKGKNDIDTISKKGDEITEIIQSMLTNTFTNEILKIILGMDLSLYSPSVLKKHEFIKKHLGQQSELSGGDLTKIQPTADKLLNIFELCGTINTRFSEINMKLADYKINYDVYIQNHNENVYFMLYLQSLTEKTIKYPTYIPLNEFYKMSEKFLTMEDKLKTDSEINVYMKERYIIIMELLFDFVQNIIKKIKEDHPKISNDVMIDVFKCDTTYQFLFNALYQFEHIVDEYHKYS